MKKSRLRFFLPHSKMLKTRPVAGEAAPLRGSLGTVTLPERTIEHDFELQARYQTFTEEIARLALLGLSAVGYVVWQGHTGDAPQFSGVSKFFLNCASGCFAVSVAGALLHRYGSVDSMSCHLRIVRLRQQADPARAKDAREESRRRAFWLGISGCSLLAAATALAVGAVALALFAWAG